VTDLARRVEQTITGRGLIRAREAALVAVSGGVDSMALLHLLAELGRTHLWKLTVAHFNHRLRGRNSDGDERLVRAAAKRLGLPFVCDRADVRDYSLAHRLSLEMAGRKLRHEFLATAAGQRKIRKVILAHHADDQVELFFLRLLRGAGSEGLAGMRWCSPSPAHPAVMLIRPLLDQPKSALEIYVKDQKIRFREDATNLQMDAKRNRIRRELIPLITRKYQPALRRVVLREMEMLRDEADILDAIVQNWLETAKPREFDRLPVALQRRCLQVQLPALGVAPNFGLIEELREAAGKAVTVSDEISIFRDAAGRIHPRQQPAKAFDNRERQIALRGESGNITFGGTSIYWMITPHDSGIPRAPKRVAKREYFDAGKVGSKIVVRHWRAGDRFQPIGMRQAVKLQNLFVNQKVPRAERHRRVVAATAVGEIFWVEGLRIAEGFKLGPGTLRGLKWQWQAL